jgi:hypothetical protein
MGLFGWSVTRSPLTAKINKATDEYLDAQAKIRQLQFDQRNLEQALEHAQKRQQMVKEEENHRHRLEMAEVKAKFEHEKKCHQEDASRNATLADEEKALFKKNLEQKMQIKHDEAVGLCKLHAEQEIALAKHKFDGLLRDTELRHTQAMAGLNVKHAEEMRQRDQDWLDKMQAFMQKLNLEGNANFQLAKELYCSVIDRGGMPTVAEVRTVNVNRLSAAEGEAK